MRTSERGVVMAPADPHATSMPPCVAVIGMGRSGTSATAGLLVDLGLAAGPPDDLVPASVDNERGHWESNTVLWLNVRLLRAVGGTTFGPPPVTLEWDDTLNYEKRVANAGRWYTETYSGTPLVVKDPRMCLTLGFWRKALPVPMAALFVLRDPLAVARSLHARDELPMSLGLALWDRYVRSASLGLRGLPTLVLEYDQMLSDPIATTSTIVKFLNTVDIDVSPEAQELASRRLDPGLRHHQLQEDEYSDLATVQHQVFERLVSRVGIHGAWTPESLPEPPLWVEDCLALFRRYELAEFETWLRLRELQASRTFRFASWLKRATSH